MSEPRNLKPEAESFSFQGEKLVEVGTFALRRAKSLADAAPMGRLFDAITSLQDLTEETSAVLASGDAEKAEVLTAKIAKQTAAEMAPPAKKVIAKR